MKYLATIAVLSFIAIAVFGFSGLVTHESGFMHCAKQLSGSVGVCPNPVNMSDLHVRIYQGFSLSLLAVVVVMLFATLGALLGKLNNELNPICFETEKLTTPNSYKQRFFAWLSLHQTSDPLV